MSEFRRTSTTWKLRSRTIALGLRTLVMGVVNITPDSFSDGGQFLAPNAAIAHGLRLLDEGADLLDLGAESTRPGSNVGPNSGDAATVTSEEEQSRLLPVLEGILRARPDALISVDTYKASTARAAIAAGAEIVNDVSGLLWDAAMAGECAKVGCGVVLMHTRGRPTEWKTQQALGDEEVVHAVCAGLQASVDTAISAGIHSESIVIDPGYGFGKRGAENRVLLARQAALLSLGRPLLTGLSRKSFLGQVIAPLYNDSVAPVKSRETVSVAAMVASILHGASIVRVHKVQAAVEAAMVADAILNEQRGPDMQ